MYTLNNYINNNNVDVDGSIHSHEHCNNLHPGDIYFLFF